VADQKYKDWLECARNFGFDKSRNVIAFGLNAKMPEVMAAFGIESLKRIDNAITRRESVRARVEDGISGLGLDFQFIPGGWRSTHQILAIELMGRRNEIAQILEERFFVETRRYYSPAMHETTMFSQAERGGLDFTEQLAGKILSLPIYSDMTERECDYLIDALKQTFSLLY
jgi:dTDP-4-amino-4,6-dideoxygalactose transaminase